MLTKFLRSLLPSWLKEKPKACRCPDKATHKHRLRGKGKINPDYFEGKD